MKPCFNSLLENPRALNVRGGTKRVHELRLMWRNTRMVVLCAISAALYAAVLVPFKVVPLIPGVTELRPANAIPVVCSFLFGPAAAWGSAIGNMIGDFFGGVGPGDIFGFFGNLVYGYIPYKAWNIIAAGESPVSRSPRSIVKYVAVCLAASILCADLVGWGDGMLALRPFGALNACNAARNNFSKLPAPASRLASATAFSAVRASYPRLTSAEATSASVPAGEAAAGFSDSMATVSSLSFNSTTIRSAVFLPTPGILVRRPRSPPRIAGTSSSTLMPDRIFNASAGPTPEAESSSSKKCFSRADTNP